MKQIHTSDRILFKRCRRKWDFASPLRQNLEPQQVISPYAFYGSGFHFALEDYHGYNYFGNPIKAFDAYYKCFDRDKDLSIDCEALAMMATPMFTYYIDEWLPNKKQFSTFWVGDKPQVEVEVLFEIKKLSKRFKEPVYYSMRFDRVVTDEYGRLWVMDYKTTTSFNTDKLETDPQVNAYCWGASLFYNQPIEGLIYLQFRKALVKPPRILKRPEGNISIDKEQDTTYKLYLGVLLNKYGNLSEVPPENIETLDYLMSQETELGDKFIRYDLIRRNDAFKRNEYKKILLEGYDMIRPRIPIYPNPNPQCFNDCQFRTVCLSVDDDSDWQGILASNFEIRKEGNDKWRKNLKYP